MWPITPILIYLKVRIVDFWALKKKAYYFLKETLASSGLHRLKENDPLYQRVVGEAKIEREIL